LAVALLLAAACAATSLPGEFRIALLTYYTLTLGYSLSLKGIVLVDAIALAGLYTLRIIAGAAAVNVPLSFWMLLYSVFLFLSLAFAKRFAELEGLQRQNRLRAIGRGYETGDLPFLQSLGSSAGYLSVLVLALYINSPDIQALYRQPKAIWLLCVVMLAWISRVWMKAQRGQMHDDPVVFALKDRVSLMLGLLATVAVGVAI
jgi:4-hydroxybenzoate polyprenyltransferase